MAVKGKTNNPNGRPKGIPNRSTNDLRKAVSELIENNWETVQDDLNKLEPKDRLSFLEKLLAYSLPRLQATSITQQVETKLEGLTESQLNEVIDIILEREKQNG